MKPRSMTWGLCLSLLAIPLAVQCASTLPESVRASRREPISSTASSRLSTTRTVHGRPPAASRHKTGGNLGSSEADLKTSPGKEAFVRLARQLFGELRKGIQAELEARIQRELGPPSPLQTETVYLEALDAQGKPVEAPVEVQTRELRSLSLPANVAKIRALMGLEDLTLAMYDGLPPRLNAQESKGFLRVYEGADAQAIAMEAKVIIDLKGGEWRTTGGRQTAANAIAIRGLDLDEGLKQNANQTYDDTMYLVVESSSGNLTVFECRMTTESSSKDRGVGRLSSKQVTYVRGLHRGKDPAYRLKTGGAEGTRKGLEGEYRITGANIHSAYSKQTITSRTLLSPNVSLGCQVVAAGKDTFEKHLVLPLDHVNVKEFPYTIVSGEEMTLFKTFLEENGRRSVLVHAIPRES
jgi:hypothetical protein